MTTATRTETLFEPDTADEEVARRPMWELAECNCPDFCERDHELD